MTLDDFQQWLEIIALILAILALVVWLVRRR
jgi:hypothetical protein